MTLEDRIILAQKDQEIENDIIKEYESFICSFANKSLNRFITKQEDEFSIALMAFHEAIQKYDTSKGGFLSFAKIVIKNRLTDYLRQEYHSKNVVPFSSLTRTDEDGNNVEFDYEDKRENNFDIKNEIQDLTLELKEFEIDFFDVAKAMPKATKTKLLCVKAINYIMDNPSLFSEIKTKKYLPIKLIVDNTEIKRKIIERHRKYIIALYIIMTGEYEILNDYFVDLKGGESR